MTPTLLVDDRTADATEVHAVTDPASIMGAAEAHPGADVEAGPLEAAQWCTLLLGTARGPRVAPMACWADGAGLWLATPADSATVAALRREPECLTLVGQGADRAVVLRATARVYGLHDPLGLLLHSPIVSAAMAALGVNHADSVLDYVAEAARVPARRLPRNPVAIRLALREPPPPDDPAEEEGGIGPALPSVVPADVRRALTGVRHVVLASGETGGGRHGSLVAGPAVWGAGFTLSLPPRRQLATGTPVMAIATAEAGGKPAGIALGGSLGPGPALRAQQVTWWRGAHAETVDVPPVASSITLPD
ncbi:MAG: hypothetical protein H0T98_03960 [Euzebyaceae bacterium]|nr:hypothetical protein [Euzebyaceae bacterium]